MNCLVALFVVIDLLVALKYSGVNSYVLDRRQETITPNEDSSIRDYDVTWTDVSTCGGKDCLNVDNDVNNAIDVDCSTGYDKNELPNELPVLGQLPKNENASGKQPSTIAQAGKYWSSSEISDLIDKIIKILNLEEKYEDDVATAYNYPEVGVNLDTFETLQLFDPEERAVLVGFEDNDNSLSSNEHDSSHVDFAIEEAVPDTSMEWIDDFDEPHKVVENGFIYYDMESRE